MSRKSKQQLESDLFLRSINLAFDAPHPERIAHFRPTTKCAGLIRALLGLEQDRAFFLVAPYGSGKSLTASYVIQTVENARASSDVRREINKRLELVSPELSKVSERRRRNKSKVGLALPLHGYVPNLGEQLLVAAKASMKRVGLGRSLRALDKLDIADPLDLLRAIRDLSGKYGFDTVTIIWDEFGRHLESLIAEGRADELSQIQSIAEHVARSQKVKMTFCLILHQGLLNYASGVSQSMRSDWKKIEGRFKTVQYVDDSKEIYRLIAEVANCRRSEGLEVVGMSGKARQAKKMGLFSDFKQAELQDLLKAAYPLEPAALFLLPRVSARVAQNERTLFSFLYNCEMNKPVTPADLYQYFSSSMRADTAVGGTHRQWLETESAISKVAADNNSVSILKTACLLGLGTSGERSRANRELLKFASEGCRGGSVSSQMQSLMDKKLLLHRKHNDDVSVWHGTDVDLRGRLEEEKNRLSDSFDLVGFLSDEAAPPVWKPVQYNDDYKMRRYLTSIYITGSGFGSFVNFELVLDQLPDDDDGRIVYLLANDVDELEEATNAASNLAGEERLVVAIPSEPVPLFEAGLEVAALQKMQLDAELLESDPLALAELQQMTDDAFENLQSLVDRVVMPSESGPRWFHRGQEFSVKSSRELRAALSQIIVKVFSKTPRLNSETINRKKPSGTLINSRKKLVMGILERHGEAELGIKGYYPDKSMFNTLLFHTGLYKYDKKSDVWGYAHAKSLKNNDGLKVVWRLLQDFLSAPSDAPKALEVLIAKLKLPPIGMRAGVIPIFLAAAFRAFPSAISLLYKGDYVTDILPSTIEEISKNPRHFQLLVLDIDDSKQKLLRACHKFFSHAANYEIEENDLVRLTFDATEAWKHQLPPAAVTTRQISPQAMRFRQVVMRTSDPIQLFFTAIPSALELPVSESKLIMESIKSCCEELENVASIYYSQAMMSVRDSLSGGGAKRGSDVRDLAKQWSNYFPPEFVEQLSDGVAKGFVSRLGLDYDSDQLLIDSLASLLVKKSVRRWDDTVVALFDRKLSSIVLKIENSARSLDDPSDDLKAGLSELLTGRLSDLYSQLVEVVGDGEAGDLFLNIQNRSL